MSQKLSTKKKIKIAVLLGGLGLVAIYTNSDVLFGQTAESQSGNASAPAVPPSAPAHDAPPSSGPGGSVSETAIGQRGNSEGKIRNPFQTLREQDPLSEPSTLVAQEVDPEMPPGLRAQIILIGKAKRVASIEGARVKIGDSFYGGKVVAIEAKFVTVEFRGGKQWFIPHMAEALPDSKSSQGKQ